MTLGPLTDTLKLPGPVELAEIPCPSTLALAVVSPEPPDIVPELDAALSAGVETLKLSFTKSAVEVESIPATTKSNAGSPTGFAVSRGLVLLPADDETPSGPVEITCNAPDGVEAVVRSPGFVVDTLTLDGVAIVEAVTDALLRLEDLGFCESFDREV